MLYRAKYPSKAFQAKQILDQTKKKIKVWTLLSLRGTASMSVCLLLVYLSWLWTGSDNQQIICFFCTPPFPPPEIKGN